MLPLLSSSFFFFGVPCCCVMKQQQWIVIQRWKKKSYKEGLPMFWRVCVWHKVLDQWGCEIPLNPSAAIGWSSPDSCAWTGKAVRREGKLLCPSKFSFSVSSFIPCPLSPPLHMQLSPKVHAVRGIPWSRIATKCKQIEMPRKQKWSRFVAVEKVDHKKKAKKKSCQHVWNPPFSPADSF